MTVAIQPPHLSPLAPEPLDSTLYSARRAALARAMQAAHSDAVALIPAAAPRSRNRDTDYPYRQDSYFYYLTGFTEPDSMLIVFASGKTVLLCPPKDLEREIWDGYRLGPAAAPAALGVDEAYSSAQLQTQLPRCLENQSAVYYPFGVHSGFASQVEGWIDEVKRRVRTGVRAPMQVSDVCAILDEMRLVKDAQELGIMRRAAQISAAAHIRAMRLCAQRIRQGLDTREYHLEAELLHEFRQHGSEAPAYTSIVAAGENACVLHYRAGAAPVQDGALVLIDAGCELLGYASDITRTFPANGRFSAAQRDVYEVVLAAQEAAIATTQAGARFNDPHDAAVRILSQGLLDLGILEREKVGGLDAVIETRAYSPYYMHRTGHWLGMDVHDCGSYAEPQEPAPSAPPSQNPAMPPSRVLRPGMVLTIEPGLYIRADSGAPAAFHGIGVRIEDDAVVTAQGCELISRAVPVVADEIEEIMRA